MSFNDEIENRRKELHVLCRNYRVKKLELIGSALHGQFDDARSDVDFLVEFHDMSPSKHANCYFTLLERLQDLFKRPVDLIEIKAVRNPHFLESIRMRRSTLYAA